MTAEELKALMKDRGWNNRQLAEALGITSRAIGHYRAGQRRIPTPTVIAIKQVTRSKPRS